METCNNASRCHTSGSTIGVGVGVGWGSLGCIKDLWPEYLAEAG
jgi:hypothetical protein